MRKFLILKDGSKYELSPLTIEEFELSLKWSGINDDAYDHFLRVNKFHELSPNGSHPFSEEALKGAIVAFYAGEPVFDANREYGAFSKDY